MKFEVRESESTMNEAEAWAAIERAGEVLRVPGLLQGELSLHPVHAPKLKELTNKLLHIVVDHYNVREALEDEAKITEMSGLFRDINIIHVEHLLEEVQQVGMALQSIPFDQIILSVDQDFEKLGMSPEQIEKMKEVVGDRKDMAVAVPDPRVSKIITAGILAAGGPEKFSAMQLEVQENLPENFREDMRASFAAQISGGLSKAFVDRMNTAEFNSATVSAVIESIVAAKQALALPTVAYWDMNAEEVAVTTGKALSGAIQRRMNGKGCDCEECQSCDTTSDAQQVGEQVAPKETSTVVPGNGTVN